MLKFRPLLPGNSKRMRANSFKLCQWRFRLGIKKKLFSEISLAQTAWGGGGVLIPGGVQSWGDVAPGTRSLGMVGWIGFGLGALEVFFNLSDAVIL